MRVSIRILALGTYMILVADACAHRAGESGRTTLVVKAGVMEPTDPGVDRLHETQRITMDPTKRPGLCFLVDPPDDEPYEVYSVACLPSHPKQLTGDFAGQSESSAGLTSTTSRVDGIRPFCFDFHPGDPLGEYRVEVFINGAFHTELRMQVVGRSAE